jgi:hypothetical protein
MQVHSVLDPAAISSHAGCGRELGWVEGHNMRIGRQRQAAVGLKRPIPFLLPIHDPLT